MTNMEIKNHKSIFADESACSEQALSPEDKHLCKLMASARWQALRLHKLFGNPVAVGRDGKVIWIQPEDIEIPEEELAKSMRLPAIY